ncbi:histidine kinase [Cellulomonas endometrii]|uniref:histidine kinase n=1 Tax=Cellulomonas endometrii TaxID=3036301 RepID=UPI0024AD5CE8|nr:histidine kinase [Cellulomonas endometrii]
MADATDTGRPDDETGADLPAEPTPAQPTPAEPAPVAVPRPEPTEAELARVAEPARVRRAPKVGAFITAGVLLGALLGLIAALLVGSSDAPSDGTAFISILEGEGAVRLLSALLGAIIGAFVGAGLAVLADRRSVRRRDAGRG